MDAKIQTKLVVGKELAPYIRDLARLRCEIFCDYPYLYSGSLEYEERYLENNAKHPLSFLFLLIKNDKIIGCSSGVPMENEKGSSLSDTLIKNGYCLENIFLFGEVLIYKEFHGLGLGNRLMDESEKQVRSYGNRFNILTLFTIERDAHDFRKPKDYRDLSSFWTKKGFKKTPLRAKISYKEIGESAESEKNMAFWMKDLQL